MYRILIVDDEDKIRKLYGFELGIDDYVVKLSNRS